MHKGDETMPRAKPITNWEQVPVIFDLALASIIFGYTVDTLQKKAQKGEFPAHKVFDEWRVDKDEAMQFYKSL